jgi:hypothetical protein
VRRVESARTCAESSPNMPDASPPPPVAAPGDGSLAASASRLESAELPRGDGGHRWLSGEAVRGGVLTCPVWL